TNQSKIDSRSTLLRDNPSISSNAALANRHTPCGEATATIVARWSKASTPGGKEGREGDCAVVAWAGAPCPFLPAAEAAPLICPCRTWRVHGAGRPHRPPCG